MSELRGPSEEGTCPGRTRASEGELGMHGDGSGWTRASVGRFGPVQEGPEGRAREPRVLVYKRLREQVARRLRKLRNVKCVGRRGVTPWGSAL